MCLCLALLFSTAAAAQTFDYTDEAPDLLDADADADTDAEQTRRESDDSKAETKQERSPSEKTKADNVPESGIRNDAALGSEPTRASSVPPERPEYAPKEERNSKPAANAPSEYKTDLVVEQILWGGGTYLLAIFPALLCPPLVLGVPFASAFAVSEVGKGEGYEADWFIPGLAAFGAAFGTGLFAYGLPIGMLIGGNAIANGLGLPPTNPLTIGVAIGALGVFTIVALAQPFIAGAAAAYTFKARAKKDPYYVPPNAPLSRAKSTDTLAVARMRY